MADVAEALLHSAQAEIDGLRDQLAEAKAIIGVTNDTIQRVHAELASKTAAFSLATIHAKELEAELAEAKELDFARLERIVEAENACAAKDARIAEVHAQAERLGDTATNQAGVIERQQARIAELEAGNKHLFDIRAKDFARAEKAEARVAGLLSEYWKERWRLEKEVVELKELESDALQCASVEADLRREAIARAEKAEARVAELEAERALHIEAYNAMLARTTGGAALAGVARAGAGLAPVAGALDVRTLAGLSINVAIDRIVDAFCPPGILDEDVARLAIGEALATALSEIDTFDPAALDANAVRIATLAFVGEIVFVQIAGDGGKSLAAAPSPTAAAQREADLRSLVREVADVIGTPILEAAGNVLTHPAMTNLVSRLVLAVEAEISTWEVTRILATPSAERAEAELTEAKEQAHYANGVADLAMKHRDSAEAECKALREALEEIALEIVGVGGGVTADAARRIARAALNPSEKSK